jgi:glycosyltransferase involved in cell wall biosynthesis
LKYRILDYHWHVGHQYEMLKFPFADWSWIAQYHRRWLGYERGDISTRFRQVTHYERGEYYVALLHLDQDCLVPDVWYSGKGSIYRHLNEVIDDIPKIVIMHGTPYSPERFPDSEALVRELRSAVGPNFMVVNSHMAREQWGFGEVILHGLDPGEWLDLPKEPRVTTVLSRSGMPSYYDRPFLEDVKTALFEIGIKLCHVPADYAPEDWDAYRNFLGRSLLYFNPTRESPMPRARTEAMFSGCCVLTTANHGSEDFIQDGVNGFLVPRDAAYVARLIENLINDPAQAQAIGSRGKETAVSLFSWNRFAGDWKTLLRSVAGDRESDAPGAASPDKDPNCGAIWP